MVEQGQCERCAALEREVAALKNRLWETSELLRQERADQEACEIAADFDNTASRLDTLYREPGAKAKDEIEGRIKLLPVRAKLKETEARTANIKAQRGLIDARAEQALLNQRLTRQKIRKMELENAGQEAMIELYRAAKDAVERVGTGQMIEADFIVLESLKQIGVKIPKKLKSGGQILKQTNGGSSDAG